MITANNCMRIFFLLILSCLFMTHTHAQFSKKRQVLVFGPPGSTQVGEQVKLLEKATAGMNERHMTLTVIKPGQAAWKNYQVDPSNALTVILVGKDGGEKYRSGKLTTAQQLFDLVDAMPMRQSEMRRRN